RKTTRKQTPHDNTHQQAETRQQRRPRIPLPIPATSAETIKARYAQQNPPPQPSHTQDNQTATLSQTRFQNPMQISKNTFPAAAPKLTAPARPTLNPAGWEFPLFSGANNLVVPTT
ncbi:hypothetical protein ACFQS7_26330, partial [Dankookia sp. GCM10030260]|uniref:hypothetical protein n=1 Tax=Dankookia sp. GCM10030260 TaxID=3273390 RepID=UPI00360B9B6C